MKSLVRARLTAPSLDLTLSQVMSEIARLQSEHPEYEIFMDGDAYAIVGRRRTQG